MGNKGQADRTYKLALIAQQSPERFVLHITYLDSKGTVTTRSVSPMGFQPNGVLCYCLGRLDPRLFLFRRIMRARLQLAADVLCPEQIAELVSHRRVRRRG